MFFHVLLSFLLVTLTAVDAGLVGRSTGKATLRFTMNLHEPATLSIVEKDHARAQALIHPAHLGKRSTPEVSITNDAGVGVYSVQVGVGSPPTYYDLVVDTGSANTWVGANKSYVPTRTSRNTGKVVSVRYGSGNFTGEEWIDTITLGPDLVVEQSIGVANSSNGLEPFDGILGLGPADLTNHTVSGVGTVPTVMDNLFSQGKIREEVLGILFAPANETKLDGELTFGGFDESATAGPVSYVPLTKTPSASRFWGIEQSISYGSDIIMKSGNGIVDTGTTLIYIAPDSFKQYQSKTGATYDNATQFLKITCEQYDNLKPLIFNIGNVPYELTPNAQIWPRTLNSFINGASDAIYLVVQPQFRNFVRHDVLFTIGYTFLERFYSVFDTTHQAVGFAKTKYTYSDIN